MVDVLSMVVPFLAGLLVGVVGLSQYDARKAKKKPVSSKRKEGAAKAAATRRKKAAEKFENAPEQAPNPELVDANLYGRKANGEGSWPV